MPPELPHKDGRSREENWQYEEPNHAFLPLDQNKAAKRNMIA
jgi:hypothetical protein